MKLGPSITTIYNPKLLAKSHKARIQTEGHMSILRYGGLLSPIPVLVVFLCVKIYSFSFEVINL